MLQSEFFDRTKVTLTSEEYADVERIYNEITMDKDEFCRLWLAIRNNPLFVEMADVIKKMQQALKVSVEAKDEIVNELVDIRMKLETSKDELEKAFNEEFEAFAREMVVHEENDAERYDAIEKKFGLGFICRIKLEEDYDLEENERRYLIKQIQ